MKNLDKTHLGAFNTFFAKEDLKSTYRPVFLKSMLYLGNFYDEVTEIKWGKDWITEKDNTLIVKLDFFSVPFTKFYWDSYYKFRLKQSDSPAEYFNRFSNKWEKRKDDASDLNLPIKKFETERPPASLEEMSKTKYEDLRKDIIEKSFQEPLRALNDSGLFKPRKKLSSKIEPLIFDISMVNFMKEYNVLLEYAINYKLTRYLESVNDLSTQIAEKVLSEIKRTDLKPTEQKNYDHEYNEDTLCFYCEKRKNEARDHVIPFNFRPKQELHNSVPSCTDCNSAKRDRLLKRSFFERVIERNRDFLLKNYLENYSEVDYTKLYMLCKNTYHKGKEFPDEDEIA